MAKAVRERDRAKVAPPAPAPAPDPAGQLLAIAAQAMMGTESEPWAAHVRHLARGTDPEIDAALSLEQLVDLRNTVVAAARLIGNRELGVACSAVQRLDAIMRLAAEAGRVQAIITLQLAVLEDARDETRPVN